jgi:1-acyl-sn-glycerol-3-phosphate acyltransferase
VLQNTGRIPRYLTHPGLLKFPFISNFITKLGGVVACQESADSILARDELLGVFPEGVQGAFTPYRQAYQVRRFGRDTFVKMALRHRAPIIPYVTVGSAEIYPIFTQIKSRRWTRYSEWPCLPISTFPFLPLPLPTKWHLRFLPAINLHERYRPEAAQNPAIVREISFDVRRQMQQAMDAIVTRRRSWFF